MQLPPRYDNTAAAGPRCGAPNDCVESQWGYAIAPGTVPLVHPSTPRHPCGVHIRLLALGLVVTASLLLIVDALSGQDATAAGRHYTDHTRLLYYLDAAGHEQPVKTPEDWQKRRRDILAGMQEAMGPLPDRSHLPDFDVKVGEEGKSKELTEYMLSFVAEPTEPGGPPDRIPVYLYIPTDRPAGKRLPAILALHPTSPRGKHEITGEGQANRAYGRELARR